MEDTQIIDLFFALSEQAITELDTKYGSVCHKLSYQILNNHLDAEITQRVGLSEKNVSVMIAACLVIIMGLRTVLAVSAEARKAVFGWIKE